ncbi:MAG: DUF896 domain-containing protein [Clostridia bacterium]|nr:DUF896 domain-containing protein [Clostridia bacterium]MEE1116095.1 DUF896 domain-containing protein [Clostridia bacterium]
MKEERLARYKELCAKAKEAPLSEDELAEQGALRLEYFAEWKAAFRQQLENTVIQRPDGSKESLNDFKKK